MGSKKSKTASVVYVPATTTTTEPAADTSAADAKAAEEAAAVERAGNVLKSKRGMLGTILTSGRGVFRLNDLTPQRKSLLGE